MREIMDNSSEESNQWIRIRANFITTIEGKWINIKHIEYFDTNVNYHSDKNYLIYVKMINSPSYYNIFASNSLEEVEEKLRCLMDALDYVSED